MSDSKPLPHGKVKLVGGPRAGETVSSLGGQYIHFPVASKPTADEPAHDDVAIYRMDGTFVELRDAPSRRYPLCACGRRLVRMDALGHCVREGCVILSCTRALDGCAFATHSIGGHEPPKPASTP